MTKIITWLLFVLTFSLRMEKCSDKEQVSPQSSAHCLFSVQYGGIWVVYSSVVHPVK